MDTVDVVVEDGTVVGVPMPRVPPKPRLRWSKRRKLARKWLRQFGQSTADKRVNALAMHVGRFHPKSKMGQIASSFVAQNQLPLCEDVVAMFLHKRAKEIHKTSKTKAALDSLLQHPEALETQVLKVIDEHWEQSGLGPAWGAIGTSVGLDRDATTTLIRHLKNKGLISYTQQRGSLRRCVAPNDD